jgi:DNA-binding IclR family transcriptional regulator
MKFRFGLFNPNFENKHKVKIFKAFLFNSNSEKTIAQLSEATGMSREKTMFLLMSLIKFGFASAGTVDDMDEYFTYKLKTNEQN